MEVHYITLFTFCQYKNSKMNNCNWTVTFKKSGYPASSVHEEGLLTQISGANLPEAGLSIRPETAGRRSRYGIPGLSGPSDGAPWPLLLFPVTRARHIAVMRPLCFISKTFKRLLSHLIRSAVNKLLMPGILLLPVRFSCPLFLINSWAR